VVITDRLDARKLNLASLSLGPVSFGTHVITPPPGLSDWAGQADLRPAKDEIVKVRAHLDRASHELTWTFTTIDATTGELITDPSLGFLPPDKRPPNGEGSVSFTVAPRAGLRTGARVANKARIVFDTNQSIDTPTWINTIDRHRPSSHITNVTAEIGILVLNAPHHRTTRVRAPVLLVRWTGRDRGSGIRAFDVYMSVDRSRFDLWLLQTRSTHSAFPCRRGREYRFYAVARDKASNAQTARPKVSRPVRCG
jgi:hypothetical protein